MIHVKIQPVASRDRQFAFYRKTLYVERGTPNQSRPMKTLLILPVLFFFALLQSPRESSSAPIVSVLHGHARTPDDRTIRSHGGIIRMDPAQKVIFLTFTGHEFADGGASIRATLQRHRVRASFFFTGDFYRATQHRMLIEDLLRDGHYLGAHSDRHLLYCAWENRDSLLVSREQFLRDLEDNYAEMQRFGIDSARAPYFMPPFEWYNDSISVWTHEAGLTLVNFTPGTSSNADYTTPDMGGQYVSSDSILTRILRYETTDPLGLNGFILLLHLGTDPRRPDPMYDRLDELLTELDRRGYRFNSLPRH